MVGGSREEEPRPSQGQAKTIGFDLGYQVETVTRAIRGDLKDD